MLEGLLIARLAFHQGLFVSGGSSFRGGSSNCKESAVLIRDRQHVSTYMVQL